MEGYNLKSPAVKRLMREAKELREPTTQYYAKPLEDNLFEWHFTILGPKDSSFESGRYHGRIILPTEYPMKPPSIILLTPNGRFEVNKKICLSMSSYHPELWQPSWSIRTALLAIIGFMPSEGGGAIGSVECPPEARKSLAKKSLDWTCQTCGVCNRFALLEGEDDPALEEEAASIANQMSFKSEAEVKTALKEYNTKKESATPAANEKDDTPTSTNTPPSDDTSIRRRNVSTAEGPRTGTTPPRTGTTPPRVGTRPHQRQTEVNGNQRGTASLVVMWLLLLMIFVLIARRAYYSYLLEDLPQADIY